MKLSDVVRDDFEHPIGWRGGTCIYCGKKLWEHDFEAKRRAHVDEHVAKGDIEFLRADPSGPVYRPVIGRPVLADAPAIRLPGEG